MVGLLYIYSYIQIYQIVEYLQSIKDPNSMLADPSYDPKVFD